MEDILRDWHKLAIDAYVEANQPSFTFVAYPGSGKTRLATALAHSAIKQSEVDFFCSIAPSRIIKKQWANEAHIFGMKSLPFENGRVLSLREYKGMSLTYQQLPSLIPRLSKLCMDRPVALILDEIHHAGAKRAWSKALDDCFGNCERIWNLSGTLFRSDNVKISFVRYDDNVAHADFEYGYQSAVADGVCCRVRFTPHDGKFIWSDDSGVYSAGFKDDLEEEQWGKRLNTALMPDSEFVLNVLRAAHANLTAFRKDFPSAGGLVICKNVRHAKDVAAVLAGIIGEEPEIVHSDDEASMDKIEKFSLNDRKWIVAVRMISEGVDIRRLKVLAYLTNYRTELAWHQAIGRIARVMRGCPNECHIHFPADPTFMKYVTRMSDEQRHEIGEDKPDEENAEEGDGVKRYSSFVPMKAVYEEAMTLVPHFEQEAFLRQQCAKMAAVVAAIKRIPPRDVHVMWIRQHGKPETAGDFERKLNWLKYQAGAFKRIKIIQNPATRVRMRRVSDSQLDFLAERKDEGSKNADLW